MTELDGPFRAMVNEVGNVLRNALGVIGSSAFLVARRLETIGGGDPQIERHLLRISLQILRFDAEIGRLVNANRVPPRSGE